MNRRTFVKTLPALTVLASTTAGFAQETRRSDKELKPILLPKPEVDGGKSVLAALKERKTTRNISARELPLQVLSNLLWAAFGVNREKGSFGKPGRTAASASNSQEIDLYVARPEGVYFYEAIPHRLVPVVAGDFCSRAGRAAAASAPVNIFYVVDLSRLDDHRSRLRVTCFTNVYFNGYWTNTFGNTPHQLPDLSAASTNSTITNTLAEAPRVMFPSYTFRAESSSGLAAAFPVEGVPVGLNYLRSDNVGGSVSIIGRALLRRG